MATHISKTTEERDSALRQDMIDTITMIEKNSKPTKRWWHYLGIKPVKPRFTFIIDGRPEFTAEELAERRVFLDGYSAGRVDGDCHMAYKLWKKMRDNEE